MIVFNFEVSTEFFFALNLVNYVYTNFLHASQATFSSESVLIHFKERVDFPQCILIPVFLFSSHDL